MCALILAITLSVFMYSEIRKRKNAERILKASENDFRLLFVANPNPMFIFDEHTYGFLAVNDAAVIEYGYSRAEFLTLTVLDIRPPEDRVMALDTIARHQGARESFIGIIRHRRKDGTEMLMETTVSSVAFAGRPSRLCLMKDISDRELANEALRQSEARYRILHETMRDGFVQVSMGGKIIEFNRIYHELLGDSPDELRALTYQELTPERWHEVESRIVHEQILIRGYSDIYEKEYRRKNGTILPVELRTILLRDDAGRPIGMWATVRDVSKRKKAEVALRQSREDLDRAQAVGQIGWWRLDTRINVLTWSDETHHIFGVPKGTPLTYESFLTIVHPDDRQYVDTRWQAGLRGDPYDIEHRIVVDGRVKWVREKAYLEFDRENQLLGGFGITQDITARKRAEEALRASEELNRRTLQALPAHIAVLDHEGRIIATNQAWEEFATQNEAAGQLSVAVGASYLEACRHAIADNDESAAQAVAGIEAVMTGRQAQFTMEYACHSAREQRWFYMTVMPLGAPGESGAVVTHLNITARKQAEESLRESEAKYRNLFTNMAEEVHFWQIARDEGGRIKTWRLVDVNPPTLKTWGRSSINEILGKTTDEIFGPGATDHYMPVVQRIMTEGVPYSFEDYFPNLDKYFRFTSVPLGDYFITTGADITEIRKAHEALRESERRWAVTLGSIGDAVIASDTNGRVTFMNPVAEKLTGWNLSEAAGRPVNEVFHIVNEHTRAVVDDPVSNVLQTGKIVGMANHTVLIRKGGGEVPIDDSGAPIQDVEGNVLGVVLIFRDITARKQAEDALRQLNESLEQRVAERTSELAHTIDTLQGEIVQRAKAEYELKLANEQLAERADQLRRLAGQLTMTEQAERKRISKILHDGLQQHLVSAKMQIGGIAERIGNVDLKQEIAEIEKIIGDSVNMSRSLSAELSPPILYEGSLSDGLEWLARWMLEKNRFPVDLAIKVVPNLREDAKVLMFESVREMLFNALKHSKASSARVSLEPADGGGLRLIVSDEGVGFDPRRLNPIGVDAGLGLFSIRERICLIGGSLEIESAPGKGSRMALTVPLGQADAAAFPVDGECTPVVLPPRGAAEDPKSTIRVLLVDDHELFRNGLVRQLKNEPGLEVVGEAQDGREAIDFAQELKPDVILMDISMPGINGIEATRVIHEQHSEIRIIGLSMYDDPERERAMRAAGAIDYKTKGCARAELVAAIRASLQIRKSSP
jgi:PAS domain S-box-containing protein